jgi:hypothetical protein
MVAEPLRPRVEEGSRAGHGQLVLCEAALVDAVAVGVLDAVDPVVAIEALLVDFVGQLRSVAPPCSPLAISSPPRRAWRSWCSMAEDVEDVEPGRELQRRVRA